MGQKTSRTRERGQKKNTPPKSAQRRKGTVQVKGQEVKKVKSNRMLMDKNRHHQKLGKKSKKTGDAWGRRPAKKRGGSTETRARDAILRAKTEDTPHTVVTKRGRGRMGLVRIFHKKRM